MTEETQPVPLPPQKESIKNRLTQLGAAWNDILKKHGSTPIEKQDPADIQEQNYRDAMVQALQERDAARQQVKAMRDVLRQAESALSGMLHHDAERAHFARTILEDIRTELEG